MQLVLTVGSRQHASRRRHSIRMPALASLSNQQGSPQFSR
jgi:hypothetical protein